VFIDGTNQEAGREVMPPDGYTFWDWLMAEQGVTAGVDEEDRSVANFNVGDVIVGEIVEDEG
jgi:hypothetical protein